MEEPRYPWENNPSLNEAPLVTDFTYPEFSAQFERWGLKTGNLDRFFRAIYKQGLEDLALLTDHGLPQRLAKKLADGGFRLRPFAATERFPSEDGSSKYVFTLHSGQKIECVYMPVGSRTTVCVSSQVGCAMGCTFCATGKMGLVRNLSAGEIVGQVLAVIKSNPFPKGQRTSVNVVFMGMGEPLHNLEQVMRSFEILTHPLGLAIWDRDIAVSTSGLVPKIRLLASYPRRPMLMVSIAATTNPDRSSVMPVNRAYPLEELFACLETYPLRKRERIMLSYVLIQGINDRPEDVVRLSEMAGRFPCLVNIIPMNEHEGSPQMNEPEEDHIQLFTRELLERGVFATIRRSKGRDVAGACGQLVQQQSRSPRRQRPMGPQVDQ